jgi:secreted protein with Ig-like and vWFA domain
LKVAKECLLIILSQLQPEDSFGLVLFNETATVIQPMTKWKDTDKVTLEKAITKFRTGGGTAVTAGKIFTPQKISTYPQNVSTTPPNFSTP